MKLGAKTTAILFTILSVTCIITYKVQTSHQVLSPSPVEILEPKPGIFFIESKPGKRHLTAKESCSIETASINHPNLTVTVYNVNGNFDGRDHYVKFVLKLPNVHLQFLNATETFSGTPFEDWYKSNTLNSSYHPAEHLSDALRLAILYKNGGIYLDTDCIVLKAIAHFRNTIGDMGSNTVNNAVMIFERHSELNFEHMNEFVRDFNGKVYSHQGVYMMDKLVKKYCGTLALRKVYDKPEKCRGITVKPRRTFQPMMAQNFYRLFDANFNLDLSESYVFHLFGKVARLFNATAGDGSFIDRLFKKHCPLTHKLARIDGYL